MRRCTSRCMKRCMDFVWISNQIEKTGKNPCTFHAPVHAPFHAPFHAPSMHLFIHLFMHLFTHLFNRNVVCLFIHRVCGACQIESDASSPSQSCVEVSVNESRQASHCTCNCILQRTHTCQYTWTCRVSQYTCT